MTDRLVSRAGAFRGGPTNRAQSNVRFLELSFVLEGGRAVVVAAIEQRLLLAETLLKHTTKLFFCLRIDHSYPID